MNLPIGATINAIAIVIGSINGVILNKNLPKKIQKIVFQGTGLVVLIIGIKMALEVENIILLTFCILLGGIFGEAIDLEKQIEGFADIVKNKIEIKNKDFLEGAVAASLIVCTGSMAIMGSLNEGIHQDRSLLITKSILDGFIAIALASTYGISVALSAIPILIYEGSMTIFASHFQHLFSEILINQITSIGGLLIMGIGLNFLEIKKIKVVNLLPALLAAVFLTLIFT